MVKTPWGCSSAIHYNAVEVYEFDMYIYTRESYPYGHIEGILLNIGIQHVYHGVTLVETSWRKSYATENLQQFFDFFHMASNEFF